MIADDLRNYNVEFSNNLFVKIDNKYRIDVNKNQRSSLLNPRTTALYPIVQKW